ncbi:MAG TPA: DUF3108 domain-containing protein [bacterium]|nr:DUF3108 domain-containing protein [bacterium]
MNNERLKFRILHRLLFFLLVGPALQNHSRAHQPDSLLTDTLYTLTIPPDSAETDSTATDSLVSRIAETDSILARSAEDTLTPVRFRTVENHAFGVGEHLEFDIAFKFITAGTATMSVLDTMWVFGRPSYHIRTTASSNAFFSRLYRVRDRVESLMDMQGLFSWKFEKHLREGRYRADRYATFDQRNGLVYYRKDTVSAPLYVQDILASLYFARTQPLEVGRHLDIDNFADGKVYSLRVLVHRKETVKVPAGKFKCLVVEPVLREEGLFKQKGKLTIWLTDDTRRMPVLMKSKILVGSIDARLTSYRLP